MSVWEGGPLVNNAPQAVDITHKCILQPFFNNVAENDGETIKDQGKTTGRVKPNYVLVSFEAAQNVLCGVIIL